MDKDRREKIGKFNCDFVEVVVGWVMMDFVNIFCCDEFIVVEDCEEIFIYFKEVCVDFIENV